MVFKSAYQRSFRGPKWDNYTVEEFQNKLKYRADRRSIEHQHQAWLWDSDSEDEVEEIPIPKNKPAVHLPTEPNDNERRKSIKAWVDEQRDITGDSRKTDFHEQKEETKLDDKIVEARKRNNDLDEAERQHRRRGHKTRTTRDKLQPSDREQEMLYELDDRKKMPPFLAYGWANDAPTELRKTHNVLATDREVYPAALRASKRRQTMIKQKVKLHEEAIKKKQLTSPVGQDSNPFFLKDLWLTEYQRNFCKTDDLADVKRHHGR